MRTKAALKGKPHIVRRTIKVHRELVNRLDKLTSRLEALPAYAPSGQITTQDMICVALRRGIEALEQESSQQSDKG